MRLTGPKTASMGLFSGFKIKLPEAKALPEVKDEWVVILGGAGSVGQYAVQVSSSQADQRYLVVSHDDSIIQLAKLSGYKVVATCSAKTASVSCLPRPLRGKEVHKSPACDKSWSRRDYRLSKER